jgi:cell division protein FtsB
MATKKQRRASAKKAQIKLRRKTREANKKIQSLKEREAMLKAVIHMMEKAKELMPDDEPSTEEIPED